LDFKIFKAQMTMPDVTCHRYHVAVIFNLIILKYRVGFLMIATIFMKTTTHRFPESDLFKINNI